MNAIHKYLAIKSTYLGWSAHAVKINQSILNLWKSGLRKILHEKFHFVWY